MSGSILSSPWLSCRLWREWSRRGDHRTCRVLEYHTHLNSLTLPETSNVIYDDFFAKITHHGTVVAEPFSHGFDDLSWWTLDHGEENKNQRRRHCRVRSGHHVEYVDHLNQYQQQQPHSDISDSTWKLGSDDLWYCLDTDTGAVMAADLGLGLTMAMCVQASLCPPPTSHSPILQHTSSTQLSWVCVNMTNMFLPGLSWNVTALWVTHFLLYSTQ